MPAKDPDSPRVRRFVRALRKHPTGAEGRFWKTVARSGSPLVEPIAKEPGHSWVTYLWHGGPGTRSVGVFTPQTEFGQFDRMDRIPGSQVWYRTSKVRNDAMGAYVVIPNLPKALPTDTGGYLRLLKRGKPDPLNPRQFISPIDPVFPDHPIYGMRSSVLHLKDAPDHREVSRSEDRPTGSVKLRYVRSRILKNRRRVWVYRPPKGVGDRAKARLVIFFDGFAYTNEIDAPVILDNLIARGRIPPTYALFVDALELPVRQKELPCYADFGKFLVKELLPWSRRVLGRSFPAERTALAGFSYGGLCSMYWAMRYPKRFGGVISQSGSFWWKPQDSDEPVALAREFLRRPKLPLTIYMDVGRYEGAAEKENGAGHLGSNRHLRDVLLSKGYPVKYQMYNGGHDTYCWRQTLVDALPWVVS